MVALRRMASFGFTLLLALTAVACSATHADGVVINELRAGTSANGASDEFVEVINPGPKAVNISSWTLAAYDETCTGTGELLAPTATETFPSGFWIARGQRALVASEDFDGPVPDVEYGGADLIGPDGALKLFDETDARIDTVGWDGAGGISSDCAEEDEVVHDLDLDQSLGREHDGWDSGSNLSDFVLSLNAATPTNRTLDGGVVQDTDGDNTADPDDNCPAAPNPQQQDPDGDGLGNPCDADDDQDGVADEDDNCRVHVNPDQIDSDEDGVGTACDPDAYNRIAGIVKPYAGVIGELGSADGDRSVARFDQVQGMASDGTDLYLVENTELTGTAANPPIVLPDQSIRKIDTVTGQVTTVVSPQEFIDASAGWAGEGTHPLLVDIVHEAGFLYMTGYRMRLAGTSLGYDYDPAIIRYELASGELAEVPLGVAPNGPSQVIGGIETDGTGLFFGESNCAGTDRLLRIPLDGGPTTTVASFPGGSGCDPLNDLELSPNLTSGEDELFAIVHSDLIRIDPVTGAVHTMIDDLSMPASHMLSYPVGLAVAGGVVFLNAEISGRSVWAVDRTTGAWTDTFAGVHCGPGSQFDCGNTVPHNVPESGAIGPDVAWHAGSLAYVGGKLFVADQPPHGQPHRGSYHAIREVEILPDAVAPLGSALLSSSTPERRSSRAAESTLSVSASDQGEGRIPSGVRFLQVRQAGGAGTELPWRDISSSVTVPLGGALEIRFRDRASNVSQWVAVGEGIPESPTQPQPTSGPTISPSLIPPAPAKKAKKKKKKRTKRKR